MGDLVGHLDEGAVGEELPGGVRGGAAGGDEEVEPEEEGVALRRARHVLQRAQVERDVLRAEWHEQRLLGLGLGLGVDCSRNRKGVFGSDGVLTASVEAKV